MGAGWVWNTHGLARRHSSETLETLLALQTAQLREIAEGVRLEVEQIALDDALRRAAESLGEEQEGADRALGRALVERLSGSSRFEGALVLDPAGRPALQIGETPGVRDLAAVLEPQSALEADLSVVMRGAELRKMLSTLGSTKVRTLDISAAAPPVVASVPLRDFRGRVLGTLHALVRSELFARALRPGDLGPDVQVLLVDSQGRELASSESQRMPGSEAAGGILSSQLALLAHPMDQRRTLPLEALGLEVVAVGSGVSSLLSAATAVALSLALTVLLAAAFGALAFVQGTRLARPLWRLREGLARAGDGQDVVLDVPSVRGEPESLVRAFNAAMGKLGELRRELDTENRSLREQNQSFQAQHENLSKLTLTDALTKLPNRRFFEDQIRKEIKRLARNKEGLSMLVVDIDDFKKLNDQFGHAAGDEFLRQVARILGETVRATDLVARFGGEEFVIIATATPLEGALVLAEKVCTAVAEASFIVDATMRPRRATVSIGVAAYSGSQTDLFNSADAALYEAKAAGKNCVVASGDV